MKNSDEKKKHPPISKVTRITGMQQLLSDAKRPLLTAFSSALRRNFYCFTHPDKERSSAHGQGVPKVKNRLQGKKYRISRHSFLARPPPYQLLRQLYSHRVGRQGFCKKYYLISVEIFCKIHFSLAWVGWGA